MSKFKKVLSYALVIAMTAGASFAGTYAYLTSEDSDVNVMTLGNVKIEQHEYERVVDEKGNPVLGVLDTDFTENYGITESYKLQPFTQGKPAYPAVYTNEKKTTAWDEFQQLWNQVGAPGSNDLFDDSMKNVVDKFVFVENTGKSDAYYRTLIAIEYPESVDGKIIHTNFNSNSRFDAIKQSDDFTGEADKGTKSYFVDYITIDGNRYALYNMTYNVILTPGEVSRPSLLQVYLDPIATNKDCEAFGNSWDILVFSQAVQAQGFSNAQTALDAAFGPITTINHPWSENAPKFETPEMADNELDLEADYFLTDASFMANYNATEDYTINGNGHTVNMFASEVVGWDGVGNKPVNGIVFASEDGAKVTVNDITFTGSAQAIMAGYYNPGTNSSYYNTELNNVNIVDIETTGSAQYVCTGLWVYGTATLNDCTVTGTSISPLYYEDGVLSVYDVGVVNNAKLIANNSTFGTIFGGDSSFGGTNWAKSYIELNNSTAEKIYASGYASGGAVVIKSGSEVGTIVATRNRVAIKISAGTSVDVLDLTGVTNVNSVITVEDGATVGKIVADGVEYNSVAEWYDSL